ncbi:MAG: phosphatase PAP2 family protein [Thermotaleaceae bacterium]
MFTLDKRFFLAIYAISLESPKVAKSMILITKWSSKVFAFFYIGIVFLTFQHQREQLWPLLLGPAIGLASVYLIRFFYFRARPFVDLQTVSLIKHEASSSLPSKHAVSAFVIAASSFCIYPNIGIGLIFLAALTGLSRIMVGVHYPLDILSGAALGIVIGLGSFALFI